MKAASWRTLVVAAAALLLALVLFAFGRRSWQRFAGSEEMAVAVALVKQETRPLVLRVSGELQPSTEVEVFSRLAGRLTEVKFKTGDAVSAGAIVASVHSGEIAERVRLVEAELNTTRKQLQEREQQTAEAEKQLARQRELYRQELIARREVEQAEIHAATARAQLELLRAQIAQEEAMLTQARKLQQLAHVVAPISGVVTGVLPVGSAVNDARAILTIAQIDTLKLVGEAPAKFGELIHDGMMAQVSRPDATAGGRTGKLTRLDGKAASAQVELEITVDNRDHGLAVGTAVIASLALDHRQQVLTLPRSALQADAGKHYVLQLSDGRARRHAVEIDDPSAETVAIRNGLKAGDMVIVERLSEISDGMRVRPAANAK